MKRFEKTWAVLLALVMIVGMLPINAFAQGLLRGVDPTKGEEKIENSIQELNKEDNSERMEVSELTESKYNNKYFEEALKEIENLPTLDGRTKKYTVYSEDFSFVNEAELARKFPDLIETTTMKNLKKIYATPPLFLYGENVKTSKKDKTHIGGVLENLQYYAKDLGTNRTETAYCLDLGKQDPDTEKNGGTAYEIKDGSVENKILAVLNHGYPKMEDTKNPEYNKLFEYATAIAVKMASEKAFMQDGANDKDQILTVEMLDGVKTNKAGTTIIPSHDDRTEKFSSFLNNLDDKVRETVLKDLDDRVDYVKGAVRFLMDKTKGYENKRVEKISSGKESEVPEKIGLFTLSLINADGTTSNADLSITTPEGIDISDVQVFYAENDTEVVKELGTNIFKIENNKPFYVRVNNPKKLGEGKHEFTMKALGTNNKTLTNICYKAVKNTGDEIGGGYQDMFIAEFVPLEANAKFFLNITKKEEPKDVKGEVTLSKTDFVDGKGIPGAKIAIFGPDDDTKEITNSPFITDKNGEITVRDLAPGKYKFIETVAPDGYILSKDVCYFTINEDGNVDKDSQVELKNKKKLDKGEVTLSKTDLVDGKGIPGAKIAIFGPNDDKKEIEGSPFITDEYGKITVKDLVPGKYKFIETVAPNGYVLSKEECYFTIDEDGQVDPDSKVELKNERNKFIINKINSKTREAIPNVVFRVTDSNGKAVLGSPFVTDINGRFILEKVPYGKYKIEELRTPKGYAKMVPIEFEINENTIKQGLTIENNPINVKLTKKDSKTKLPVPGAMFEIRKNNILVSKDILTDRNGEIDLSYLEPGEYTVKEVKAPAGYLVDYSERKFVLKEDGSIEGNLEFFNTPISGKIIKVDAFTGEPLKGANFAFFNEVKENVLNITTNERGELDLSGLSVGNYTFRETKAPEGYKLSNVEYRLSVALDGTFYSDTNTIKNEPNIVELKKVNNKDQGLEGAEFDLKDSTGKLIKTIKSEREGRIEIRGLTAGEYTVEETKAPQGYIKSNKIYKFTVLENGEVLGDTKFVNEDTYVEIFKENEKGERLEGAEFEIFELRGRSLAKAKTDRDGRITIRRLPIGIYTLKEIKAPTGYVISDKEYQFEIKEDGTVVGETTIVNKVSEIILRKLDKETDEPLEGAKFTLKSGTKIIEKNLESDRRGEIIIKGLSEGTYTLEETEAPEGYIKDEKEFKFTVDKDGKVSRHNDTIYNSKASFKLVKKDLTTGAVLEGASFTIRDKNDKVVARVTTNRNGEAVIEGLGKGRYTLEETVAPEGYVKATKTASFEVDKNGKIGGKDVLEVFNKAQGKKITEEILKKKDEDNHFKYEEVEKVEEKPVEKEEPKTEVVEEKTTTTVPGEEVKTGDSPAMRIGPVIIGIAALILLGVFTKKKKDGTNKKENKKEDKKEDK